MGSRLKLKFGEIELEIEGSDDLIERERNQFYSLLPQAVKALPFMSMPKNINNPQIITENNIIEVQSNTTALQINPNTNFENLTQFLREKNFAADTEKTLGVAYYLNQYENFDAVTVKEIETKLAETRTSKKLTNINASINCNVGKGLMEKAKEKKAGKLAYYILEAGKTFCENYIPPEKAIKKNGGSSKKKTNNSISELTKFTLDDLKLEEKYFDISCLSKLEEQIMVIMYIFNEEKNIDLFTRKDLMDVLINTFKISTTERKIELAIERCGTKLHKNIEKKRAYYKLLVSGEREVKIIIETERANQTQS